MHNYKELFDNYQQQIKSCFRLKAAKMTSYGVDPDKLHKHGLTGVLFELSRKGARVDSLLNDRLNAVENMKMEEQIDLFQDIINYSLDAIILLSNADTTK